MNENYLFNRVAKFFIWVQFTKIKLNLNKSFFRGIYMLKKYQWIADLTLLMISIIWGITFILVQDAIYNLPPFTFLAIRFAISALILISLFPYFKKDLIRSYTYYFRKGVILGIYLFLGFAFQTFSLLYTTSGKSGFLTGICLILVPFFAWIILKKRIQPGALIGTMIAIIGLYLIAFNDIYTINQGDILGFLCAFFFALQIVYTSKYTDSSSVIPLVIVQLITVFILSNCSALLFEPGQKMFHPVILFTPTVGIALLITSIFATSLAFLVQTYVQKYTTPTHVSLIFATEPIFAGLADYWWKGVSLEKHTILGFACIICGIILSEIDFRPVKSKLVCKFLSTKKKII
jgi:drug/metabolite transporter (DMT)-like permease